MLLLAALGQALFLIPAVGRAAERGVALAEVEADAAAVRTVEQRRHLASALLAFTARPSFTAETASIVGVLGIAPERVDALAGRRPRFETGIGVIAAPAAAIILLVTLGVASALVPNASLSVPLLLAQSCTVLMLGLPLAGLIGLFAHRTRGASLPSA